MDGVIGVTQCGIAPGNSSIYEFSISEEQSGTFWYHAHSAVQRADGLFGGLIVHRPVPPSAVRRMMNHRHVPDGILYQYDRELLLLIGDWYHRPARDVLAWYMRAGSLANEVHG
jgi:FtsP/CotA-like multicopper oxidase with cupredoxin domain